MFCWRRKELRRDEGGGEDVAQPANVHVFSLSAVVQVSGRIYHQEKRLNASHVQLPEAKKCLEGGVDCGSEL